MLPQLHPDPNSALILLTSAPANLRNLIFIMSIGKDNVLKRENPNQDGYLRRSIMTCFFLFDDTSSDLLEQKHSVASSKTTRRPLTTTGIDDTEGSWKKHAAATLCDGTLHNGVLRGSVLTLVHPTVRTIKFWNSS